MRIFIAGIDGYLGWSLALYLADRGHVIGGADEYLRRDWVQEVGSHSAIPIARMTERGDAFVKRFGQALQFYRGDLTDYAFVENALKMFRPDAIVHLGEMPSAPYSMIDVYHANFTHTNNLIGTLNILHAMRDYFPACHLLKLGTAGEYGTPNVPIPEGDFEVEYGGRKDILSFPRQPGSLYHCTKVHDSVNVRLACRLWNLRSTDIMQGVVYGVRIPEMEDDPALATRFDFDGVFGTAINRFCAQAVVGHEITPYGYGHQKRGFLALRDSMQCMCLLLENPPGTGEYRTVNQFEAVYDITELAEKVATRAARAGMKTRVRNLVNPRDEEEDHFYEMENSILRELGFKPTRAMDEELDEMLVTLDAHRDRIHARKHVLIPDVRWSGQREPVGFAGKKTVAQ